METDIIITTTAETGSTESRPGSQVKVQFITKHADIALPQEFRGPILLPTDFKRFGLSRAVNHLLKPKTPIPFDFLIDGTIFLRSSLEEYLNKSGRSSESTLTLEYVRALSPPLLLNAFEHDDWVSAVDVLPEPFDRSKHRDQAPILSGSYDGVLRVWNSSGASSVAVSAVPPSGDGALSCIKVAKWVKPGRVVSGGIDRVVRLWDLKAGPEYSTNEEASDRLVPIVELYGHKGSVEDLDVDLKTQRILSASTDGTVGLWSTSKKEAPSAPTSLLPSTKGSKRRKISGADVSQRGPFGLFEGHRSPVSSVIFDAKDSTVAYSVSLDHTLITWDLPTSTVVDTRTTSHSLLSVCALPELGLLAAGTSARHITLLDPRANAATVSKLILRGHQNAVVSLSKNPSSQYGIVSGSHDGTCKVWDVRRQASGDSGGKDGVDGPVGEAVYTIEREITKAESGKRRVAGEGIKVFSVHWDEHIGIVSGGEDKRVQVNRGAGMVGADQAK